MQGDIHNAFDDLELYFERTVSLGPPPNPFAEPEIYWVRIAILAPEGIAYLKQNTGSSLPPT